MDNHNMIHSLSIVGTSFKMSEEISTQTYAKNLYSPSLKKIGNH